SVSKDTEGPQMCAQSKPQPEPHESVQDRFAEALERYGGISRAVVERPDVPARGKLLLALSWTSILGIVPLGIRDGPFDAYASLIVCTLAIALLINRLQEPRRKTRRPW